MTEEEAREARERLKVRIDMERIATKSSIEFCFYLKERIRYEYNRASDYGRKEDSEHGFSVDICEARLDEAELFLLDLKNRLSDHKGAACL